MIVLNKNQLNTVILRLTGISSLPDPNYLFEFKNDINSSITYFTAPDLSTFGCAYNRFEITEAPVAIPLSGTANLLSGMYTYNIYESSATTLSVSATTGQVIETGKAVINGINNEIQSIYR
jgi:hypothetical protein